jgi:hypothetical protein
MPVAFCKEIFSCKLVCKDEVSGPRNVDKSLPIGRQAAGCTNKEVRSLASGFFV